MRRRDNPKPAVQSVAMEEFIGTKKAKPKAKRGKSTAGMDKAIVEAGIFLETGEWEPGHDARQIVGLYAVLHEKVYGVAPEELEGAWMAAVSAATRLIDELGKVAVVAFLRFTWKSERAAEKRAEGTGVTRRRVGWYLQFVHRALVVDFKRAMVATRKVAKR